MPKRTFTIALGVVAMVVLGYVGFIVAANMGIDTSAR